MSRYEESLICDLAETYKILDYRALSPELVATLVSGLPNGSRIMREITGMKTNDEITMLAAILDETRQLAWMFSKDGARGRNRPKSVLKELAREKEHNVKSFESLEEFRKAWQQK